MLFVGISQNKHCTVSGIFHFDRVQSYRLKICSCSTEKIFSLGWGGKDFSSNEKKAEGFDICRRLRSGLSVCGGDVSCLSV